MRLARLTIHGQGDACTQMALDEAMAVYAGLRGEALLRLYWFNPPAVTIGYFQRLEEAVDMREAGNLGISVVRRVTGGGSVYHDPHAELVYSVAAPEDWLPASTREAFRAILEWLIDALRSLGIEPQLSGVNDIIVDGRKVSGNAQARLYGAVLQHGTILLEAKRELMERVLRVPPGKGWRPAQRVAGLRDLGYSVTREELIEALRASAKRWAEKLDAKLVEEDALPSIVYRLGGSLRWKYCSREWLTKR